MSDFSNEHDPDVAPQERVSTVAEFGVIRSHSAPVGTETGAAPSEQHAALADPPGAEPVAAPTEPARHVSVELSNVEARVLGSLIEKSFLTPDVYPMTTNSLVTASNQKTNRDPVMSLTPVDIDGALLEMRQRNLVRRVHAPGSRSSKHRQTLDEVLLLNERQTALLSVLLLRGPQTIGELRLRTERHDVGFDDLEAVETCLEGLAGRSMPIVQQLARQPGHKEARWQHLIGDPDAAAAEAVSNEAVSNEAVSYKAVSHSVAPAAAVPAVTPAPAASHANPLDDRVQKLERHVAALQRQLASLADQLGASLE